MNISTVRIHNGNTCNPYELTTNKNGIYVAVHGMSSLNQTELT